MYVGTTFPSDKEVMPVVYYGSQEPPIIPNIVIPDELIYIRDYVCSTLANMAGRYRLHNPSRMFCYNVLQFCNFDNDDFSLCYKYTIGLILRRLKVGQLENLKVAIEDSCYKILQLYTAFLSLNNKEVSRTLTKDQLLSCKQAMIDLEDVKNISYSIDPEFKNKYTVEIITKCKNLYLHDAAHMVKNADETNIRMRGASTAYKQTNNKVVEYSNNKIIEKGDMNNVNQNMIYEPNVAISSIIKYFDNGDRVVMLPDGNKIMQRLIQTPNQNFNPMMTGDPRFMGGGNMMPQNFNPMMTGDPRFMGGGNMMPQNFNSMTSGDPRFVNNQVQQLNSNGYEPNVPVAKITNTFPDGRRVVMLPDGSHVMQYPVSNNFDDQSTQGTVRFSNNSNLNVKPVVSHTGVKSVVRNNPPPPQPSSENDLQYSNADYFNKKYVKPVTNHSAEDLVNRVIDRKKEEAARDNAMHVNISPREVLTTEIEDFSSDQNIDDFFETNEVFQQEMRPINIVTKRNKIEIDSISDLRKLRTLEGGREMERSKHQIVKFSGVIRYSLESKFQEYQDSVVKLERSNPGVVVKEPIRNAIPDESGQVEVLDENQKPIPEDEYMIYPDLMLEPNIESAIVTNKICKLEHIRKEPTDKVFRSFIIDLGPLLSNSDIDDHIKVLCNSSNFNGLAANMRKLAKYQYPSVEEKDDMLLILTEIDNRLTKKTNEFLKYKLGTNLWIDEFTTDIEDIYDLLIKRYSEQGVERAYRRFEQEIMSSISTPLDENHLISLELSMSVTDGTYRSQFPFIYTFTSINLTDEEFGINKEEFDDNKLVITLNDYPILYRLIHSLSNHKKQKGMETVTDYLLTADGVKYRMFMNYLDEETFYLAKGIE